MKMKKLIFITAVILLGAGGCKDLAELNEDPNRAAETHPQFQLTKVQWEAFRAFGGTTPLYALKMLVQTDGENTGQYYKWNRGSFGPYSHLRDIGKMMQEAERLGLNSYIALGRFFRAYYFYNLALTFGDIPYSEALLAEAEDPLMTPAYDEQEAVFAGILNELEEAARLLEAEGEPLEGDIIFDGEADGWRKLINAFRLKVLMTLSEKETVGDIAIQSAFAGIVQEGPLMEGPQDDAQLVFLDQEGNRYPQFNESAFGSGMYMDSTFVRRLQDREDPRLFAYCTQTRVGKEAGKAIDDFSSYEGGDPAAPYARVNQKAADGKVSKVNERYYEDPTTEPAVLLGYAQQQLILAEAAVRGWITGNAGDYYEAGVKASFEFYETYAKRLGAYFSADQAGAYLSGPLNDFSQAGTDEEKIQRIIMQRYLQSFFQSGWSAYYDRLRTSYPEFRRPAGVELPWRWMYPQSEYNYNGQHVSDAIQRQFGEGNDKINQKTWWQK